MDWHNSLLCYRDRHTNFQLCIVEEASRNELLQFVGIGSSRWIIANVSQLSIEYDRHLENYLDHQPCARDNTHHQDQEMSACRTYTANRSIDWAFGIKLFRLVFTEFLVLIDY